jgi:hypothetical protein
MTEQAKNQVVYVKTTIPRNPPKENVEILVLEKGKSISGTFENIYAPSVEGYKPEMVITNGDKKFVLSMNTSLYKMVEWQGVQPGHKITVSFEGQAAKKEKGKQPMNLFKIVNADKPAFERKVDSKYEDIKSAKLIKKSEVVEDISDDEIEDL